MSFDYGVSDFINEIDLANQQEVEDFCNNINIKDLSWRLSLPEPFVYLLSDRLDWSGICCNSEKLSEEFLLNFIDRLDLKNLIVTRQLSENLLEKIVEFIPRSEIDLKFIECYQSHLPSNFFDKLKLLSELEK